MDYALQYGAKINLDLLPDDFFLIAVSLNDHGCPEAIRPDLPDLTNLVVNT
jgi:hypothetical protein